MEVWEGAATDAAGVVTGEIWEAAERELVHARNHVSCPEGTRSSPVGQTAPRSRMR